MKTLWQAIVLCCVANVVLALALLAGLGATGRLSRERVQRACDVFRITLADEQAELEAAETMEAQAAARVTEQSRQERLVMLVNLQVVLLHTLLCHQYLRSHLRYQIYR